MGCLRLEEMTYGSFKSYSHAIHEIKKPRIVDPRLFYFLNW